MTPEAKIGLATAHPHEFTIQYPPRREYFQDCFRNAVPDLMPAVAAARRMLLYVHVPFCKAKCYYCNFAVDVRPDNGLYNRYVDALVAEIQAAEQLLPAAEIPGIDIGGGTPTILHTDQLMRILSALQPFKARSPHPFPLSIETTPFIAANDPAKLKAMVAAGVDRISVGLQSTNDAMLSMVNRGDQQALGDKAIGNLLASGFKRVSVDLIFALPGQTADHFRLDLDRVSGLRPDTITTYDCLYRGKGRVLTKRTPDKPDAQRYGELYDIAYETLTSRGYHAPYGSVNFCLHESETGTSAYFEHRLLDGMSYLGLGNYASSLNGNSWWFAPYRVNDWLARVENGEHFPVGDSYDLPAVERMAKYLLLSLSFGFIDPTRFRTAFAQELEACFGAELSYAREKGWLLRQSDTDTYRIAEGRFGQMPQIRSLFYSDRVIEWLQSS